jgi:hypothetical protein
MARARRRTIRLTSGDVRALVVVRRGDHIRLVIHDDEGGVPLVQALLGAMEARALRAALARKP